MTEELFFPEHGLTVCFNSKQAAAVQSYQIRCTAVREPIYGFWDSEASGILPGKRRYEVTLRRLYPILPGLNDGISLFELQSFTATIRHHGRTVTFSGCEWSSIRETADPEQPVIEEMVFVAAARSTQTDGEGE